MRKALFIVALISALTATTVYAGQNEFAGTLVGATVGGVSSAGQIAATDTGALIGGMAGKAIARSMDRTELYYNSPAYAYYEPHPVYYSFNYYTPNYVAPPALPPSPPPIYVDETTGSYCRAFSQTVQMNGRLHESYGTVCLQPNGSWRVVQ